MTWSGQWVADRLGVGLEGDPELTSLLGLAVRRNKKRAHLLVSHVLGKHVPAAPSAVYGSGVGLGRRVRDLLGDEDAARAVVLGYAETATGLGHAVADGLALAPYLHSTRRPVAGVRPVGGFEEEHSHATSHLLLPEDPELLAGDGPLVLVDDEFSTGRTVLNTITTLHANFPRERYVVVALVDMRSAADRAHLDDFATGLGARVDLIALASGTVSLPEGVLERGQELVARHEALAALAERGAVGRGGALPAAAGPHRVGGWVSASGATVRALDVSGREDGRSLAHGGADPGLVGPEKSPGGSGSAAPGEPLEVLPDRSGGGRTGSADGSSARPERLTRVDVGWPEGLPDGGRHGFTPGHRARLEAALPGMAARVADALAAAGVVAGGGGVGSGESSAPGPAARVANAAATPGAASTGLATGMDAPQGGPTVTGASPAPRRVLVLGSEELMYAPLRLAAALQDVFQETRPGATDVRFSTTTRSPVLPVDDPGYAIRTRIAFPAHDDPADGPGERYAYNVAGAGFDAVVAVVDSAADTPRLHAPGGLLDRLGAHTGHVVLVAVPSYAPEIHTPMPEPLRGPAFSSYDPADVGWLLQDLSDVSLEAPTEEREEAIQSGGAHYAESLPVEYQPSADYQALFHAALDASAARMARAVGVVTETVLAERSPRPVLVSLARAGTPVGVLMRRWARHAHGLDLPHYAVSIVRGRGIDPVALRWLAAHHDPADVVFVDGWTGKGAITRELAEALRGFDGFDPRIAVLADPGHCVDTYGTRDDFLIPSACLNSTVSGLISRTVLRADLVGPHDFHGAKFYRELAGADVSRAFLDTVAARFAEVEEDVAADAKELAAADRAPTWEGWAAVERISEEYGIHDVNLVKPGVGETTRVLLRRVPWKILAQRGAGADLDHVRLLAEQRGVPVEEVDGLPYSCVGLIHPRYTRGATGADGKAVTAP
ncbi:phosphoribosyltransferase [Streptomyces albireticuli]|uniref:Phosphoribosyltransferase n=1 Tax=Streptomyces albireticuli TaxID=1940 RepID=A0A2A2DAY5_9ACTN|nr:phosphoribosyltransferase [Streptomyces albireticuli]MCD9141923.1 phosphoribosyltransferase [Streptomyces albireticuli]MCD9163133.1 phosphoribosyltransferase [Streptomyces albireticuli]MCD9190097.1 phosphoribosyltransferase [Streptomyces albireticuli]PAU49653.1 phosphoribosyltransferase [Streptomyces albireticuli]